MIGTLTTKNTRFLGFYIEFGEPLLIHGKRDAGGSQLLLVAEQFPNYD